MITPPITPPISPVDSIRSWKKISSFDYILDMLFTSSTTGYFINDDNDIYKSNDSGYTWVQQADETQPASINFFFVNSQYGFEQGPEQIGITTDAGNTWSLRRLPTSNASGAYFLSSSTVYYVDLYMGMYKTQIAAIRGNLSSRIGRIIKVTTYSFLMKITDLFLPGQVVFIKRQMGQLPGNW